MLGKVRMCSVGAPLLGPDVWEIMVAETRPGSFKKGQQQASELTARAR